MHTLTITSPSGTFEGKLPSSWEECTAEQFLGVLAIRGLAGEEDEVRFALVRLLAEVPDELMEQVTAESVTMLVDKEWVVFPQVSWALSEPTYTTSKLPTIEHDGTTWIGPDNELERCTVNRYVYTCSLLNMLRDNTEEVHLNNFLAAAYQPKDVPWSNEPIEEYAARLATVPMATKLLAVRNFEALHNSIVARYSHTFDPTTGGDPSPMGLMGLVYDVARSGTFGPLPQVEGTLMHHVLGYVEHNSWKAAQQERAPAPAEAEA